MLLFNRFILGNFCLENNPSIPYNSLSVKNICANCYIIAKKIEAV